LVVGDNAKALAQLRAGSHWLGVESGRHEAAALHRSQRREHASLFSPWPESLRSFMGQDLKALAAFAYA